MNKKAYLLGLLCVTALICLQISRTLSTKESNTMSAVHSNIKFRSGNHLNTPSKSSRNSDMLNGGGLGTIIAMEEANITTSNSWKMAKLGGSSHSGRYKILPQSERGTTRTMQSGMIGSSSSQASYGRSSSPTDVDNITHIDGQMGLIAMSGELAIPFSDAGNNPLTRLEGGPEGPTEPPTPVGTPLLLLLAIIPYILYKRRVGN